MNDLTDWKELAVNESNYIYALKYQWLTRLYDPVVALTTRERYFRQAFLNIAQLQPGDRVLDLACGSGSFSVLLAKHFTEIEVVGLDGDPNILAQARRKARQQDLNLRFDEGMAQAMPYGDLEFDVVFSSLFFHHLSTQDKKSVLMEIRRVLRPGGGLKVLDWGRPKNWFSAWRFSLVRFLDGFDVTEDNYNGRLPELIAESGFQDPVIEKRVETPLGTLDLMSAKKVDHETYGGANISTT
jgi:ubiquinone/menaquinone biosynthesis C-methylase UbiE